MSIESRIQQVKNQLAEVGDFRPGSVSQQYNVCGKKECRCKDKKNPQKHGPYYILSYRFAGKNRTEYVSPLYVAALNEQLARYQDFQKLIQKWVGLQIERSRLEMAHISKARGG
jgi:hypothetical protein